jgi:predicted nucleotidyltransferase
MNLGLSEKILEMIKSVFSKYGDVTDVILYGSRATDNYREGSDIDMAVKGENLTPNMISQIKRDLEELDTAYMHDVLHYDKLSETSLKEHIDKKGVSLFA